MAFYFALFNVSAINLEEHGKRQNYKQLRKSNRRGSLERTRQRRYRSADGRPIASRPRATVQAKGKRVEAADNESVNSATLATQEETLSNITANWSMDSIPLALRNYRELPKPRIRSSDAKKNVQRNSLGRGRQISNPFCNNTNPAAITSSFTPPLANGDVPRISAGDDDTDDCDDAFGNIDTPRMAATRGNNIPKSSAALARRGSTPSYKRVTFRHDNEDRTMRRDDSPCNATRRSSVNKSDRGGFFSKPVSFLGKHSLDDHLHPHRQHPLRQDVDQDRPFQTKALANSKQSSKDENVKNRPPSALSKLRAVIKKLMVENRHQPHLESHWPGDANEASCRRKAEGLRPEDASQAEAAAEATTAKTRKSPATPAPTPIDPQPATLQEQIRINFQNIANSMLEIQQKSAMNQYHALPQNHFDRFSSMRSSPECHQTTAMEANPVPPLSQRYPEDTQQKQQRIPENVEKYHPLIRHQNSCDESFVRLISLTEDANGRVDESDQRIPQNNDRQSILAPLRCQPRRRDWTKRWNSLVIENTVTRNGSKAGAYHPRLLEEQIREATIRAGSSRRQELQPQSPGKSRGISDRDTSMRENRTERNHILRGDNEKEPRSRENPVTRQGESQNRSVEQERVEKNRCLVRRRSTTDKKSNFEKSRSLIGSSLQRWFFRGNGTSAQKYEKRINGVPAKCSLENGSEQLSEFELLLSQVRYDENRNLSFENGESSSHHPTTDHFNYGRFNYKMYTRSLIIASDDPIDRAPVGQPDKPKKSQRKRLPLNCYINPLFTSHSAPNSPARKQEPQQQKIEDELKKTNYSPR